MVDNCKYKINLLPLSNYAYGILHKTLREGYLVRSTKLKKSKVKYNWIYFERQVRQVHSVWQGLVLSIPTKLLPIPQKLSQQTSECTVFPYKSIYQIQNPLK